MADRRASDVFVECLEAEGVRHAFGLPGQETLDLNGSLSRSSALLHLGNRLLIGEIAELARFVELHQRVGEGRPADAVSLRVSLARSKGSMRRTVADGLVAADEPGRP